MVIGQQLHRCTETATITTADIETAATSCISFARDEVLETVGRVLPACDTTYYWGDFRFLLLVLLQPQLLLLYVAAT